MDPSVQLPDHTSPSIDVSGAADEKKAFVHICLLLDCRRVPVPRRPNAMYG